MPILQARESIMRINESAYAFGGLEENDATAYIRELRIAAQGKKKAKVLDRPRSVEEMMGMLRTSGSKGAIANG